MNELALADADHQVVIEVVAGQLAIDPSQIIPEARIMEDLGADSLDVVEIGMKLEERLNISIPETALERSATVAGLCETVANLRGG